MFGRFSHILVYVRELERAVEWYQGVLGFTRVNSGSPRVVTLFNQEMSCRLDLHLADRAEQIGTGPVPYFGTDAFEATLASLQARDIRVSRPRATDMGDRFVRFQDSEGNILGLEELALASSPGLDPQRTSGELA